MAKKSREGRSEVGVVFVRQIRLQTRERGSKAKMMSKGSAISDAACFDYMNINFASARISALCARLLSSPIYPSLLALFFSFRSTGKYIFPRYAATDNNNRRDGHQRTRWSVSRVFIGRLIGVRVLFKLITAN